MANSAHPQVSVIVPMYNVEQFLPRCLDSIDAQTLRDIEVILIDDCSTDGSLAIANEYARTRDSWTVAKNAANLGISAVRNLGVSLAKGDFIGFVDSDDWVEPTMFETLLNAALLTKSSISQVQYEIRSTPMAAPRNQDEAIRVISGLEALEEMLLTEKYAVWFMLYHRSLFSKNKEWFPTGLTCEDRVANSWILPQAERVAISNRIEYYYYLNLGSISYSGLDRRSLDILEADKLLVANIEKLSNRRLLQLAHSRAAKGPFSLLVKWARFGITDSSLVEEEILPALWNDFRISYSSLMASPLSLPKKIVAWQLRNCPSLLKWEFSLYDTITRLKGAHS